MVFGKAVGISKQSFNQQDCSKGTKSNNDEEPRDQS